MPGFLSTILQHCERTGEVYHAHYTDMTTNEMKIFQQVYLQLESVSQLDITPSSEF